MPRVAPTPFEMYLIDIERRHNIPTVCYIVSASESKSINLNLTMDGCQNSLVDSPRTSSGNRTRTSTSSCDWPNGDRPCWSRALRLGRRTGLPTSRLWCSPDVVPVCPSRCIRLRWSLIFRSDGTCE